MSAPVESVAVDARLAVALTETLYGLRCSARRLASEGDAVFALDLEGGDRAALKVSGIAAGTSWLEAENRIVDRAAAALPDHHFPRVWPSLAGRTVETWVDESGAPHAVRLLDWVPGRPLAMAGTVRAGVLRELGRLLGRLDAALATMREPAASRRHLWDPREAAAAVERYAAAIGDARRRAMATRLARAAASRVAAVSDGLRTDLIHADANDHNVFIAVDGPEEGGGRARIAGLIDFGDALESWVVAEPAIAAAYAMMGRAAPIAAAAAVLEGYESTYRLHDAERTAFYPLILLRLCASVSLSAHRRGLDAGNAYLNVSEAPAWALLERLAPLDAGVVEADLREAVGAAPRTGRRAVRAVDATTHAGAVRTAADIEAARRRSIGPSLRLSYRTPLHIVRGWMQYLYELDGRRYLDCVNNVAHVGHTHPRVVEAIAKQAATLNTNTRYLHEHLAAYAERLAALLPQPLRVCYFVNSGSEANELALRLARAHTRSRNVIVVEGAYHGNTSCMIELSPYKFDGPGGAGAPDHVWTVPMPDAFRGLHRDAGNERAGTGSAYAAHVGTAAADAAERGGLAAFFVEPLLSCAGQIVPPEGWLAESFQHVRAHGGVCVADEVQVGLGRVGSRFWGFELDGVVPDIVTLGKPIGNGHPLGAVVTTPHIAASFDNGMEYFNTFGGNPVSCAAGLAVLDVIAEEELQSHAQEVGGTLEARLRELMKRHETIGDVRGRGLFLGIELVHDRGTLAPAPRLAEHTIERMRERGILLSTDGPLHNVIKIKPPLPFDAQDADHLASELDDVLANEGTSLS